MKIKGAIFDMDGTIVNSLMFWQEFWKSFGKDFLGKDNFTPSPEVDKKIRTITWRQACAMLKDEFNLSCSSEEIFDYADKGLESFYKNVAHLKEGVREFLDYLKDQGVKLAVASASMLKDVEFALRCYNVRDYFETVVSCAEIGVGKDKPDIFLLAMNNLGVKIEDSCVFEDSILALQTAKKAGFKIVGVYDQYSFEQEKIASISDYYVDKNSTMKDLIGKIEG